jgi:hypothetical protein
MNKKVLVVLAFVYAFGMILSCVPHQAEAMNTVQIGFITPTPNERICGQYGFNFYIDSLNNISDLKHVYISIASQVIDVPKEHMKAYTGHNVYGCEVINTKSMFATSPYLAYATLTVEINGVGTMASDVLTITVDNNFGGYQVSQGSWKAYNINPAVSFSFNQDSVVNGDTMLPAKASGVGVMAQDGTTFTPIRNVQMNNENQEVIYFDGSIQIRNSAAQDGTLSFVKEDFNTKAYKDGFHFFVAFAYFENLAKCASPMLWLQVQNDLPPATTTTELLPYMFILYSLPLAIGFIIVAAIMSFMPAPGTRVFAVFLLVMAVILFIVYYSNQATVAAAVQSSYDFCFWISTVAIVAVLAGILCIFVPAPGYRVLGAILIVVGIVGFLAIQYATENTTPIDEILRNLRHWIPVG